MQFFIMLSLFEKKNCTKKKDCYKNYVWYCNFCVHCFFLRDREKRAFGCNYVQIMIYGVWLTGNGSSIAFQPQLLRLKKNFFRLALQNSRRKINVIFITINHFFLLFLLKIVLSMIIWDCNRTRNCIMANSVYTCCKLCMEKELDSDFGFKFWSRF